MHTLTARSRALVVRYVSRFPFPRRYALVGLAALVLTASLVAPLSAAPAAAEPDPGVPGGQVADLASAYVGAPYVWGGSGPGGFDCTGFVQWVYGEFGVALPRSETGQWFAGEQVSAQELLPGDVVVFQNTYRAGLSHTGIYLGEGQFVHAVDEQRGVAISDIGSAYWAPRLVGASRLLA